MPFPAPRKKLRGTLACSRVSMCKLRKSTGISDGEGVYRCNIVVVAFFKLDE